MAVREGAMRATPLARGWFVVIAVAALLAVASAARYLFGVVIKPVGDEFGWSRAALSTAATINFLLLAGLQPLVGWAADRWGSRRILLGGIALNGAVVLALTRANQLWQVYLLYGVVAAIAAALTSPVNTTRLISGWFTERRGVALALTTSGSAIGQVTVIPIATAIMLHWSWRVSYEAIGLVGLGVMLPLGWLLVRDAPRAASGATARATQAAAQGTGEGFRVSVGAAMRLGVFWRLVFGLFVCGFTMSFTSVHLVPYMLDMPEHSHATMQTVASTALSVVGACSILGTILFGWLADRAGSQPMLALTYFLRGLAFVLLLVVGPSVPGIFVAAIVLGISWTSTTPLTSAITADVYGRNSLGAIFGAIYVAMHLGSGVGAWVAGLDYDRTGNYGFALLVNAALGFTAAAVVLAMRARPFRPQGDRVGQRSVVERQAPMLAGGLPE
jgi:MFS family permease